jgi:hypothetical protein
MAAAGIAAPAAAGDYSPDPVDDRGMLPDMYTVSGQDYAAVTAGNANGDKTGDKKLLRHFVFALITAWASYKANPMSLHGMKRQQQVHGLEVEFKRTLAVWAHNAPRDTDGKLPWLLTPAPTSFFVASDYAELEAATVNGAERGSPNAMYKVMLFPLMHAAGGKAAFRKEGQQGWSLATAAKGESLKAKTERLSRILRNAEQVLLHDADSPANGWDGQKRSGTVPQDSVIWMNKVFPGRCKESGQSNEWRWLFWYYGAGAPLFGKEAVELFKLDRTDGKSTMTKAQKREKRKNKGRLQVQREQEYDSALQCAAPLTNRHV